MLKDNFDTSFVAAVVLGSSKITGIVGRKEPEGIISVLSHVSIPSTDFINKGRVFNAEKMTSSLKNIRERLEEQINRKINKVYVGIDCMGLRSIADTIERNYNENVTITQEIVDQLIQSINDNKPNDRTFLETIPLEYRIGTRITNDPVGVQTNSIKAQFLNLACNTNVVDNIESCFRKAGIGGLHYTISATQLAQTATTEQERTSGCAFISMSSETTTIAVYKGKLLRYLAVIPLGGANITRDIANVFNCEQDEAETLKVNAGYPDFERIKETGNEPIYLREGGRTRQQSELGEIIEARVEEIIQNIKHQIELSGLKRENLVNGLYVMGSAAQLKDIGRAFEQHFKDWNIRFIKSPSRLSVNCVVHHFNEDGAFDVALSIVENGDIDCNGGIRNNPERDIFDESEEVPVDEPVSSGNEPEEDTEKGKEADDATPKNSGKVWKIFKNIKRKITDLVSEDD